MLWFFLSSGIFLGWSLGANDAANIFGTAVGSRMVKFRTAALITCVFVAIGAVISGAGASHTLGKLGAVNALAGSFTVAMAAAVTVAGMTRVGLPVSTSQAIVGAIVGWNLFTGSPTEMKTLTKIMSTWVLCPVLSAVFSLVLYRAGSFVAHRSRIHLLRQDAIIRAGLVIVGAFGAYSLGANNIANVMGVFVSAKPFDDLMLLPGLTLTGTQLLFLLGSVAIGVGVITYSRRVMETVGGELLKLTPLSALVVVLSQSMVLFLFASKGLETWLSSHGLPTVPLVPVSSSQAVIGAVLGIGMSHGLRRVNFRVLARVASGWVTTPIIAGLMAFVGLFFVQNVFELQVVTRAGM